MREITTVEERKKVIQLMRLGYGIHPERDIVLIDNERFTEGELNKSLHNFVMQYSEVDFILLHESKIESDVDEDNLYELIDLDEQYVTLLKSVALLEYTPDREIVSIEFKAEIVEGLKKDGFNREGTTLLAVNDDDTTSKKI